MIELSVDWEDDDSTLDRLRQSQSAQGGVARLSRVVLDGFIALLGTDAHRLPSDSVSYERQPIEGNDSHGNILFDGELPRSSQKQIAAYLASAAFLL